MEKAKKKMKKKKDWQTKEKKRNYKQHDKGIIGLLFIIKHFSVFCGFLQVKSLPQAERPHSKAFC